MQFTDVFIRRPVFASALSFMVLVIGIISFMQMPVRQYPQIDSSVITVTTTYPGASAELMAGFVTTPLESSIGSIDGIDYMTSTNLQNTSQIVVNLQLGYPMEKAITDIANEVSSVRWKLPKDVQDPVIAKTDPNAEPIVYLAFSSDTMSSEAVTDYMIRVVQPQLETLDGVSQAQIMGEREYAMRINLDSQLMKSLQVTPNDVMKKISDNNLQAAAGRIEGELQEYNVTANTDMASVPQFENLVVKSTDGNLTRLQDVADIQLGAKTYRNSAVVNGKETIVIGIIPTSDANPLAVSEAVHKILPEIQETLPKAITATITYDSSLFIAASIDEVYHTMGEATLLVIAVIFLFLGSFRAVVIPLVTIPLSLIGVCGIMLALGFSINTLTLLAWVIAIGLVVDDAIVVLENIYRHMEEGVKPMPASIIGAREIGFAVIAMTITLAAVYAPIGFTGGLTGILFTEFAFTLAAAVIVSGFIALTLSPMMCSRILTLDSMNTGFSHKIDEFFEKFQNQYKNLLLLVLKLRWIVVAFAAAATLLLLYLMATTPEELAPVEDQGVVLTYISGPSSSNIKFTEKYTAMMDPVYNGVPEKDAYGIINGYPSSVNSAISFLSLIPWDERSRTAMQISQALFPKLWAIPGLKIIPFDKPPLPGSSGALPLQFVLKATEGVPKLYPAILKLMQAANDNPGFLAIDTDMKINKPQIRINIDRARAGDLGISMRNISDTLSVMFGQPLQVQFSMKGRSYYVIPELNTNFDYKANPKTLDEVYVKTDSGKLVPLSSVISIEEKIEPQSLNHFQQLPSASLLATLATGYTVGQALEYLQEFATKNLSEVQTDTAGQARQFIEAQGAMTQVLIMAVILIFLVLAAQFESYRDPFIVLLVVPLTLCGAILTLRVAGMFDMASPALSIYSKIGLTTLVGLIAKHGILIVEFANQLQEKGHARFEAIVESATLRLRPILMTTGAMVLGIVPLALATGAGSQARNQLGWVIVGGMVFGTLFSLFVVPAFYSLIAKTKTHDTSEDDEIQAAIEEDERKKKAEIERIRNANKPADDAPLET